MILYAFGFCILGLWLYMAYLYNSFVVHPTSPVETTGQTVPFQVRNRTVYITEGDLRAYSISFYVSIAGFVFYATAYTLLRKRLGVKDANR